ncbi:MAG: AAA family ATPase [Metamycoplasmataceae bacterium]
MNLEETKEYKLKFNYINNLFISWKNVEYNFYFSDAHSWFVDDAFETINDFFDDHLFFKILLIIPTYLFVSLIYILSMAIVIPIMSIIQYCIRRKRWINLFDEIEEICEDQEKLKSFLSQENININKKYICFDDVFNYLEKENHGEDDEDDEDDTYDDEVDEEDEEEEETSNENKKKVSKKILKNRKDIITPTKIENFKNNFEKSIIGQPKVIKKVNELLISEMYNVSKKDTRPIGVLFFAGPTGVGKTESVKELSKYIYENENFHRFDMSEYKQDTAINKFIGADNGFVGFEEGGTLINAMKKNPSSIILFDEIEKANSQVFDMFLQILDEGVLTSNKGKKIYFDKTIIIFTSNLGIDEQNFNDDVYESFEKSVKNSISEFFDDELKRPEILGRIGKENIVVFNKISKYEDLTKILSNFFKVFLDEYKEHKIYFTFDEKNVFDKILSRVDISKGARDIRNEFDQFKKQLYNSLYDKTLSLNTIKNKTIKFEYVNNKVNILDVMNNK